MIGDPVQSSVAVTSAFTLASVGSIPGLQPRSPPAGTLVIVGATVSLTVQSFWQVLAQPTSTAVESVKRSVAVALLTCTLVVKEFGESMVAEPETTVQLVEMMGS